LSPLTDLPLTGKTERVASDQMPPPVGKAEARLFASYGLQPQVVGLPLRSLGLRLRAVQTGARDGNPVLFIHGLTLAATHWIPMLPCLISFQCLLLDIPGHGGSDSMDFRGVDLRRWSDEMLEGCLDVLRISSVHIVGHSYGGLLALWLALDRPRRVRSITLIGTPAVAFGARPDLDLALLATPLLGRMMLATPVPFGMYRAILARSLGAHAIHAAPPELLRATHLASRRRGYATTVSSFLHEQFQGLKRRPPQYVLAPDELGGLREPVLVVWGDRDQRYQSVDAAQSAAALIPHHIFEVVHGGHEPWLDDPVRCGGLIAAFLARYSSPSEQDLDSSHVGK